MIRNIQKLTNLLLLANPIMWVFIACTALASAVSFVIFLGL